MTSLKNKSILVTGGTGFIGSHLVDDLIKENPENITVVSSNFSGDLSNLIEAKANMPDLEVIFSDLSVKDNVYKLLRKKSFDVVFNLSVIGLPVSLEKPAWVFSQNTNMTLNLCEALRDGIYNSLVQFSSSEAYGTARYVPMDEKHPTIPETPYAASKLAADSIAHSYFRTFNLDISLLRPFNNYGPRQNARKYAAIIPLTVGRVIRGEDLVIYGDGNQTRDFIYVTDTTRAAIDLYKSGVKGIIVNVAGGQEHTMNKIVGLIAENMGYTKPIVHKEARPGDVMRHYADVSLAKKLINFQPKVSIEEGIKKTVDWYLNHKECFSP